MDSDFYNTVAAEEKGYTNWVKEKKNAIMRMTNTQKKQAAWNELFPKLPDSELVF